MSVQTEMIRKTLGKPRDLSVFERVRRLNAELDRLGIKRDQEDHLVRKVFGRATNEADSLHDFKLDSVRTSPDSEQRQG